MIASQYYQCLGYLSTPGWRWCIVFMVIALFVILAQILYRLTLHPLAAYPGPFWAKITSLYAAYHGVIGDIHLDALRCHQKYGTCVRYGPNKLLVNCSSALEDIYGFGKSVQKSKAYLPMVPEKNAWSTLTTINKTQHRFKRKVISAGLGQQILKDFEPEMISHIQKFIGMLVNVDDARQWGSPKDVMILSEFLTLDIIGHFGFDQQLDMLKSPNNRGILPTLHNFSWLMGIYEQMPFLTNLKLDKIGESLLAWTAARRKWKNWSSNFASTVFDRSLSSPTKSLFGAILRSKDHLGRPLCEAELWAEGSFLMLAGSDTSATTIAALFFYLSRNPLVYDRLREEIRSTFKAAEDIQTGATLLSCSYLYACITETMRISPSTPGIPYREVIGPAGLEIRTEPATETLDTAIGSRPKSIHIPAGVDVGTCIYAMHHHPAHFPDSFAFRPERWLREMPRFGKKSAPYDATSVTAPEVDNLRVENLLEWQYAAYTPFSLGPRGCPGRMLALMEIALVAARTLWELDLRVAPDLQNGCLGGGISGLTGGRGRLEEYQLWSHVTAASKGPVLQFRKPMKVEERSDQGKI